MALPDCLVENCLRHHCLLGLRWLCICNFQAMTLGALITDLMSNLLICTAIRALLDWVQAWEPDFQILLTARPRAVGIVSWPVIPPVAVPSCTLEDIHSAPTPCPGVCKDEQCCRPLIQTDLSYAITIMCAKHCCISGLLAYVTVLSF